MSSPGRLYLDHAATTPLLAEAREAMARALENWANPSSPHADGRKARAELEQARRSIAEALDWRHDVIFTSGASEAIHIAAARIGNDRRLISPTEHEAVLSAMGRTAETLAVDANGLVDMPSLEKKLAGDQALVAIQLVNNETGVIQPIDRIYPLVTDAGSMMLVDCAQAAGKIPLPDADFIAISGHKFGGPPGAGALLVKDLATLQPSGGQERGYRRGTENLPAVTAMAAALQSRAFASAMPRLEALRRRLEERIVAAGGIVIAADAARIPTIGAYAMPGVSSASQLVQFDLGGISISAGSACSSGSMKPSHVLKAMHVPPELAASVVRVSFGPTTGEADIERFLEVWRGIANRSRTAAA